MKNNIDISQFQWRVTDKGIRPVNPHDEENEQWWYDFEKYALGHTFHAPTLPVGSVIDGKELELYEAVEYLVFEDYSDSVFDNIFDADPEKEFQTVYHRNVTKLRRKTIADKEQPKNICGQDCGCIDNSQCAFTPATAIDDVGDNGLLYVSGYNWEIKNYYAFPFETIDSNFALYDDFMEKNTFYTELPEGIYSGDKLVLMWQHHNHNGEGWVDDETEREHESSVGFNFPVRRVIKLKANTPTVSGVEEAAEKYVQDMILEGKQLQYNYSKEDIELVRESFIDGSKSQPSIQSIVEYVVKACQSEIANGKTSCGYLDSLIPTLTKELTEKYK